MALSQWSNPPVLFFSTRGQSPPQWTQGPHTTQACPYLPVHRSPEGLPYPLLVPQFNLTYISFATFFFGSPHWIAEFKSYQLASNVLLAPNRKILKTVPSLDLTDAMQTTFSTSHLQTAPMYYKTEDGKRSQSIVKSNCFNFIRDQRKRGVCFP
ncbi:hypothetical protein PROFUN_16828 [Planoprotostelium fungivorum]|uniref:Uncharacterized protein n=1 Tax=Planoprotostelium fungivorum TaxID=1890364 RepID=A0A2P6MNP6_9EUKA|nr:hypothetical protein PROFUN_16828 [Planoprotostelium fungivorum]